MTAVIVTGATGFVGRHAVAALRARGADVVGVAREDLDLLVDPARLETRGATHLLHLAWCATPPDYWTSPENAVWRDATIALVGAFLDRGGSRVVLAGTQAEYSPTEARCDERTSRTEPTTPYGAAKLAAWQAVEALDVDAAEGRLFQLYGPGEHPSRLVPSVVTALLRGEEARTTAGSHQRDFLHVADAGDALAALTLADTRGPVNIASGVPIAISDVVCRLGALVGRPDLVRVGARATPPDTAPVVFAAVDRLGREVGWDRARSLDDGLADAVDWWREAG